MKRLAPIFVGASSLLIFVPSARAGVPDVEEIAEGDFLLDPPSMDAPALRTPRLRSQIYTDFTFASSPDLSALSVVKGSAQNYRFALGGTIKIKDVELALEVPFTQITPAHFEQNPSYPQLVDKPVDKTSVSFGDVRFGATYRYVIPYYPPKMMVGGTVRGRFSTHTTQYPFDVPGGQTDYQFPHYWHVEPAGLFATALGPLTLLTEQGVLAMLGKDVTYNVSGFTATQVFPELYFWDAHYDLGFYFLEKFGFTLGLNTVIQLNHVSSPAPPSPQFDTELNGIKAVYLMPGVQIYAGGYKIDLAGRIGLSDGADNFGVISFAGRYSTMVRLTRSFDYDAIALFGQ